MKTAFILRQASLGKDIGTLAATQLLQKPAGKLFAWVEASSSSSTSPCRRLKKIGRAHRRTATSLAAASTSTSPASYNPIHTPIDSNDDHHSQQLYPFPCCALYGNPSLITPASKGHYYKTLSTSHANSDRISWKARAKRITLEDLAKDKKSIEQRKRETVRRTKPDAPWIKKGEQWFEEVQAYESQYVSAQGRILVMY